MAQIKIGLNSHRVTLIEVGTRFATAAKVRIAGIDYRSRDVPFGMNEVAVTSLLARVAAAHPGAVAA